MDDFLDNMSVLETDHPKAARRSGQTTLQGELHTWGLAEQTRPYFVCTLTYGEARRLFRPEPYSAMTGKGEQREIIEKHARKIRKAMEEGRFTPTSVSVGVRSRHTILYQDKGDGRYARLKLEEGNTLPLLNGGHRFAALEKIREAAEEARGEEKKARLRRVDAQPITAMVFLDGNTQEDFVNLQQGLAVDAAHLHSLKAQRGLNAGKKGPVLKLAFNIAKLLHSNNQNPFFKQIKFDSKSHAPLPVTALCATGPRDLSTSLVGLAKIGLASGKPSAENLTKSILYAYKAIASREPELLERGKVLTPPPDGTRDSATMLIGLGICLAYRLQVTGTDKPTERDLAQLAPNDFSGLRRQLSSATE